jgi:hypothetical protein
VSMESRGGIILTGENEKFGEKPAPVLLHPSLIPHD